MSESKSNSRRFVTDLIVKYDYQEYFLFGFTAIKPNNHITFVLQYQTDI